MERTDIAIPILPSRDLAKTIAFYRCIGFTGHLVAGEYAIPEMGGLEIHFFVHSALCPSESFAGCYLRVDDVEALYAAFVAVDLPKTGIPRMEVLETKTWGMKEFAVVDKDGNLLRIGTIV